MSNLSIMNIMRDFFEKYHNERTEIKVDNDNYLVMDPYILLSIINMKLRDEYSSLEVLCEDKNIPIYKLEEKLGKVGYKYYRDINQFKGQ